MALLEKLSRGAAGSRGVGDVVRHLNDLLNAFQGIAAVIADYGVRSEVTWGAAVPITEPRSPLERLIVELERNIAAFEPALVDVVIAPVSRDVAGRVALRLLGRLVPGGEPLSLRLTFDIWTRRIAVSEEPA